MNSNYKLDIPYIAGLFDVKGIIKKSKKNKVALENRNNYDR